MSDLKDQEENRDNRDERGRWLPGGSGNPAGRPQGSGASAQLRSLLEASAPELTGKAIELALAGDTTALRICLERVVPALKAMDAPLDLEQLGRGDLAERGRAVLSALGNGELTPEQASSAIRTLAIYSEITTLADLEARIAKLETTTGGTK